MPEPVQQFAQGDPATAAKNDYRQGLPGRGVQELVKLRVRHTRVEYCDFHAKRESCRLRTRGSFQRLVVDAYAGEKRVIPLSGANHNSPVEGVGLANFHAALEWMMPRAQE